MKRLKELRNQLIDEKTGTLNESVYEEYITRKAKALHFEHIINETVRHGDIKIDMDDVYVNGKKVGTVSLNLNDFDAGINFSSIDGSFSKEVESIKDLIALLKQRYGNKTVA